MSDVHVPVLLHEVISGLSVSPGDCIVDATVGGGGYSRELCKAVGTQGSVIGFDADAAALTRGQNACEGMGGRFIPIHSNFRFLEEKLREQGIEQVDGIAFDLGLSSYQLETSGRGFTFLRDEPLMMTFSETPDTAPFTAEDIINSWEEESIANVIFGYGEERYSRRIAKAIVEARRGGAIRTTGELVDIVRASVPERYRRGPIHPATRTFQALRIAVNDELGALKDALHGAFAVLAPGARVAVVSFHSLEDRIVKTLFREEATRGSLIITKKPLVPSNDEMHANPRARSAKLRILEKQLPTSTH